MLDSVHRWRGALQPRGLSPAMGPGPASPAPPLSIISAASSCSAARGCSFRAVRRMFLHKQDSPTGSHINHKESMEAIKSGGDTQWLSTASSCCFAPLVFQTAPSIALSTTHLAWQHPSHQ